MNDFISFSVKQAQDLDESSESDGVKVSSTTPKGVLNPIANFQPHRERGRTFSSSNETISERRQAIILKRALCATCTVRPPFATSSNESLSVRPKCVHIHDPSPPLSNGNTAVEKRCVIVTHLKPFHIYSIIPFKKRTSSAVNKVKEKLDARGSGGGRKLRQTSTSQRPMSSGPGENQPFDPFNLLGIERRTDGGQEISYGYLLVPSKTGGGKISVSMIICSNPFRFNISF